MTLFQIMAGVKGYFRDRAYSEHTDQARQSTAGILTKRPSQPLAWRPLRLRYAARLQCPES